MINECADEYTNVDKDTISAYLNNMWDQKFFVILHFEVEFINDINSMNK